MDNLNDASTPVNIHPNDNETITNCNKCILKKTTPGGLLQQLQFICLLSAIDLFDYFHLLHIYLLKGVNLKMSQLDGRHRPISLKGVGIQKS